MYSGKVSFDSDDFVCIHREKESIKGKKMDEIKKKQVEEIKNENNKK